MGNCSEANAFLVMKSTASMDHQLGASLDCSVHEVVANVGVGYAYTGGIRVRIVLQVSMKGCAHSRGEP